MVNMTTRPQLRVLFFDVFETCVAQRPPVANELWKAAQDALESNDSSIGIEVRTKAKTYDDWFEFGGEWNRHEDKFVRESKEKYDKVDWKEVDKRRIESLPTLLAKHGLVILPSDNNASPLQLQDGSLWNEQQLKHLAKVLHRLPSWPDVCHGLDLLNTKFTTATLSNTYNDLMESLVAHSSIPFNHMYTSDMFQSFKPSPDVYFGAAERMGVKSEECGLVAAHLFDLRGAKACGFWTCYVERPLEEKHPELREERIPDMVIKQDEGGFVALAERLGLRSDKD